MASLLVTQKREERWTMLSIKLVEGCLQTYHGCRRDVKQMLLPRDLSVKGVDRSYLCRKSCFASLDKIINHEKNIAELTAEVKQMSSACTLQLQNSRWALTQALQFYVLHRPNDSAQHPEPSWLAVHVLELYFLDQEVRNSLLIQL